MDFLIWSRKFQAHLQPRVFQEAFTQNSFFDSSRAVHAINSEDFSVLMTASKTHKENSSQYVIFSGYLFGKELLHPTYNPPNYAATKTLLSDASQLSGGFVLGTIDSFNNTFRLKTDILGQYQIFFCHSSSRDFALSNNLYIMSALLRLKGISARPTINNLVSNCIYLSAFGSRQVMENIQISSPRLEAAYRSQDGLILREQISRRELIRGTARSYAEAISVAAEEIKRNCQLISEFSTKFGVYTLVDLTGGMDSRLVLAGFIAARSTSSVRFLNINGKSPKQSPDRMVANLLMKRFSLLPGIGICENTTTNAILNSYRRFGSGAKATYGVGHFFGVLPYSFEDFGELYLDRFARVGGYCGEHTRAPSPMLNNIIRESGDHKLVSAAFLSYWTRPTANSAFRWLTPNAAKLMTDQFESYFSTLIDEIPPKLINTMTYAENRSRQHFGMRSQNANRSRVSVSPLATPKILGVHRHLNYKEITENKIGHDLIITLAGAELCHFPLADVAWTNTVTADYPRYDAMIIDASTEAPFSVIDRDPLVLRDMGASDAPNPYDTWRIDKGMADGIQSVFAFLLDQIPIYDDVWEVVNRAGVESLRVEGIDASTSTRHTGMNVLRLIGSLLFYAESYHRSTLKDRIDVPTIVSRAA